ncbi:MAG: multiheme c-type cytochrome [Myxococcota bacterium]
MTLVLVLLLSAAPKAALPDETAPYGPGLLRVQGASRIPPASVDDAKNCGTCHPDIAAQWKTSAHALASFTNPLYRVAIDKLRVDRGPAPSRMCAACHDLALLTAGEIERPAEIAADDPRAHAGVSCTTCHSAVHTTKDGNGSLTLRSDEVLPSQREEATLEKHRARVAADTLRTAELCGSCHRSFLTEETGNTSAFFGMDDYGAWHRSAYAGNPAERPDHVAKQDCLACHMPREAAVLGDVAAKKGTVPSHRFLGAHTTLAAMRGDTQQVARQQAFLAKAATVDVAAARVNDGAWQMPAEAVRVAPGDRLELDVVLFNERTGHRFPGGVLDNQGTRVEVFVRTANGRLLAASDEHEVRAQVVDAEGRPVQRRETHEFVTAVWNHTVPARDARVTRLRVQVPEQLSAAELPLKIEARLTHRARSEELMKLACDEAKTPRGRAFAEAASRLGRAMDPCVAQPVTLIDRAEVTLAGIATNDTWVRAYRRGLGLSVGLQEYLDEAEAAFEHARALSLGADQGVTLWALGQLAGKRGQLPQALEHLRQAEQLLGPTPAIAKARGDAYAQVWRWKEAAAAWNVALSKSPTDLGLWQSVAMAEASVGRYQQALVAAQGGLALHPRDGDCLRVQALALAHLGQPADTALDVALKWRVPDDGPRAKALCSAKVPGCANRRNPVPVFDAQPR